MVNKRKITIKEGLKIDKLKVLRRNTELKYKNGESKVRWFCECDCKRTCYRTTVSLRTIQKSGNSCGCSKFGISSAHYKGFKDLSHSLWNRIEQGAKKRSLSFAISIEYAWDIFILQDKKCALSGVTLHMSSSETETRKGKQTASLDRIDSSEGYEIGNVQWVHKDINLMKQNLSDETFINYCRLVYETKFIKEAGSLVQAFRKIDDIVAGIKVTGVI